MPAGAFLCPASRLGLQSGGERYLVRLGAEAMTFECMTVALRYLRALLAPTGVEDAAPSSLDLASAFADALSRVEGDADRPGSLRAEGSRRSGRFQ